MAAPEDIPRNGDNSLVSYTWSENPNTAIQPSSGRKDTGWLPGDTVTQGEMNWLDQTPARFSRAQFAEAMRASSALVGSWIYTGTVLPPQGLGTWSETGVINPREGFLSDAVGTSTRAVDVWIDPDGNGAKGLQVKVTLASPFLFTAISDNYVYIDTTAAEAGLGGGMTVLAVPNGNPAPATPANTVLVWIVETDASNITGQTIEIPTIPVFKSIGVETLGVVNLGVAGDLQVDGNTILGDSGLDSVTINGVTTVTEEITINAPATVTDEFTATMDVILGTDVTTFGTFNLNCTLGNSNAYTHTLNGDVTLGNDATNIISCVGPAAFIEGASIPVTKALTLTGDAQVSGVAASKVTAGTIDTIDEGGRVKPGGVEFYTDTTPSGTAGLVQWNGKRLSVGSEGAAIVIRHPIFDYVATESTAAAGTDITGLNITANVPPTQDVYITLEAHQSVDAANDCLLRIRATNGVDSVTQLKLGDDDAAVSLLPVQVIANERRPNSVRVRWRPTDDFAVPDNDTWTFFAVHGVSGGDNLTTTAATMMLQFL